jgi:hypothetical protein
MAESQKEELQQFRQDLLLLMGISTTVQQQNMRISRDQKKSTTGDSTLDISPHLGRLNHPFWDGES